MTLASSILLTLLRAAVVAAVAAALAYPLRRALGVSRGWRTRVLWVLALAPLLFPSLVTGYAYTNTWLAMVRRPWMAEVMYAGVLVFRLTPVALLVLWLAPPPAVSRAAMHCWKMLASPSPFLGRGRGEGLHFSSGGEKQDPHPSPLPKKGEGIRLLLLGPARAFIAAFAIVFLLAFQEFDLASQARVVSWAVWLFDAQAGGLAIGESLRFAAWPVLGQLLVIVPALLVLRTRSSLAEDEPARALPAWAKRAVDAYLVAAVVVVVIVPSVIVLRGTVEGFGAVRANFAMQREIVNGVLFAGASALIAGALMVWLPEVIGGRGERRGEGWRREEASLGRERIRASVVLAMCVPGLLGALALALVIQFAFQFSALRWAYDTPAPLLIAMTLLLLPPAVLLGGLIRALHRGEAMHAARLLLSGGGASRRAARELLWRLVHRPRAAAIAVLFLWAYFDLTASAILAPVSTPTASVRIYNLSHYGQSAVFSAMIAVVTMTPVFLLTGLLLARRVLVMVPWARQGS